MSRAERPPPPPAEPCLTRSYAGRGQKGGTLIAEDVGDLAAHREKLKQPGSYRPRRCASPGCDGSRLHIHARRERKLLGQLADADGPATEVMIFLCATCSATWRVLPCFLARHLWRAWPVVEREVSGARRANDPPVPERTVRRWSGRLGQSALVLAQLLATSGEKLLRSVAQRCGLQACRRDLVEALALFFQTPSGSRLSHPAALVHRLQPGGRLM